MEFKESEQFDGKLTLWEEDEDGYPEERYSFLNIETAQKHIDRLQKALDKYKIEKENEKHE